jgi:hypothetical protein
MRHASTNWVFLGDSLTEGVGSSRVSFVTELTRRLRTDKTGSDAVNVHELRLRHVEPDRFSRFVQFNVAGHWDARPPVDGPALWLWNLAAEGQMIDTDTAWLPLLENLEPEIVFVFRGSLESIVRPAAIRHGRWPAWVPESWRSYAAMDPRCYYSTTAWRRLKQAGEDALRQRVRHALLRREPGSPLMDSTTLLSRHSELSERLLAISPRVVVLGLLPVDITHFPGSAEQFACVNQQLRELCARQGAEFLDWGKCLGNASEVDLFYRDGFHPNQAGAARLADGLYEYLHRSDSPS